jgi:hypothetical protein
MVRAGVSGGRKFAAANAIDQRIFELFERMRKLHNMAVYDGHGAVVITTEEALEFLELARAVGGQTARITAQQ